MATHKPKTYATPDKKAKVAKKAGDAVVDPRRHKYQDLRNEATEMFKAAADSRRRYDWEWLTRDLFRRGYQMSRYDPSSRTVILSSRSAVKLPINLLWAQMRVLKNQVTSFRPKWEVVPTSKDEDSMSNARYSGKLLDYYFDKLHLRKKIKEAVLQGLIFSVGGPFEVAFDPDGDNGEGEVTVYLHDPFDFYIDPAATSLEEAEYCFKAVRRPLNEVKSNPAYKFYDTEFKGDMRVAESEYKQFLLQALKYQTQANQAQAEGVILKEMWQKVRVTEETAPDLAQELRDNDEDADKLRDGEVLLRKLVYLDFLSDPLAVKLYRRSDYPFVLYQADINPLEVYGESWARHVIPMNRALNALESSIFQYNYKYAKGRIVVDKNSGVTIIGNEHGEIIEKNQGSEVASLPLQPLPTSYQLQTENMRRYIEDIGGAHDVSLGRIPAGVKSGVGIAELKQADSTNQDDLIDNLEDCLTLVAQKILKVIADNYDIPKIIKALGKDGNPEHFAVVGERGGKRRQQKKLVKVGVDVFDLAIIGSQAEVRVKIGSWLAYTKAAQQDKLKELYEAGVVDQKTLLEHLEFADVDNIVQRVRQEETLKKFRGMPKGPGQVSDEEIAEQENIQMVHEGKPVEPLIDDNHEVHLAIHQDYADNPLVDEHMIAHEELMKTTPGVEPTGTPAEPNEAALQPQLPAEVGMPGAEMMPMGPEGGVPMAPPVPAGPPPELGVPGSPEEEALMQTLMAAMGGQGGT